MIESFQTFKQVKKKVLFDEMSWDQASQCEAEDEILNAQFFNIPMEYGPSKPALAFFN